MKKLRDYQTEISVKANNKLDEHGMVYISAEVRCGKTLMALQTVKLFGAKKLLFITKKIAFKSIIDDYNDFGYEFEIEVINKESIHKVEFIPDIIVVDEAHEFGAFPKAGKAQKLIRAKYDTLPMIFLSGTPHPESFCQLFHQFQLSSKSIWSRYKNFYKWFGDYGTLNRKYVGKHQVNDYSEGLKDKILNEASKVMISFTQKEAGFTTKVNIKEINHTMNPIVKKLIKQLRDEKIIEGKEKVIIADTGAKLMSKIHQLSSGTIKFDDGTSTVLDFSKAKFIRDYFKGKKIAIFYYFQEELNALKEVFGDNLTTDLEEFNTTSKNFAVQQARGAKGISLKAADDLVFYNFGFSNEKYIQAIDRLTTMDRLSNDVWFVVDPKGIENYVLKAIKNKEDYIMSAFKKDIKKC